MTQKFALFLVAVFSFSAMAQIPSEPSKATSATASTIPTVQQHVEVTATRLPEDPEKVPAAIEVISGEDLRGRGANDLRSALFSAIGVDVAPGGDAGPASAVPEFWGLKEFDAFLLVVDGVPWGGAFNPALTSLDLSDVERIEVLRGPAPITYGATSFVGAIHVVHNSTESTDRTLTLQGGSFGTGGVSLSTPIPLPGDWSSRLTVEGERKGFSDDQTAYRRGHGLWRVGRRQGDSSRVWFTGDFNWLDQNPASPRVREGATLSPLVPVDSNYNPAGAFLNDHRGTVMAGFDRAVAGTHWYTNVSISHSRQDIFRGFLEDVSNSPDNAHGFREQIHLTDLYLDSHFTGRLAKSLSYVAGGDYIHGTGIAKGADFNYTVPLIGAQSVSINAPSVLDVTIDDNRDFFGAYGLLEWTPFERFRVDAGLRTNVTRESRTDKDPGAGTSASEALTSARVGASLGAIFTVWQRTQDSVGLYANYRDTFKPAAIDFGIGESAGGDLILKPETSRSIEGGMKATFLDRRVEAEASGFLMDFSNLVTGTNVGGLPVLINAGTQRFKGFESGVSAFLPRDFVANATYSFHDARFTDFVQDFEGVPTQLGGKRLEMSVRHLAAFGIRYMPIRGVIAGLDLNYRGSVFLDKRNTALADGFADVGITAGYRMPRWELRANARNLADRRDPVAESELGDAQYYPLPSRRVDLSLRIHF